MHLTVSQLLICQQILLSSRIKYFLCSVQELLKMSDLIYLFVYFFFINYIYISFKLLILEIIGICYRSAVINVFNVA